MSAPRQDRVAAILEARDEHAREVVTEASSFPVYEVPDFVHVQFPGFDPTDPDTWPERDKCTDGRPWGHDAYSYGSSGSGRDWSRLWEFYLQRRGRLCRNRWKDPETRLCGTHVKPYREGVQRAAARLRRNARVEEHLDLARRLQERHEIEADGSSAAGVVINAENMRALLALLDMGAPDL